MITFTVLFLILAHYFQYICQIKLDGIVQKEWENGNDPTIYTNVKLWASAHYRYTDPPAAAAYIRNLMFY